MMSKNPIYKLFNCAQPNLKKAPSPLYNKKQGLSRDKLKKVF